MNRLLQGNIFGVEKDQEACNITAFSLILTLLSYLEPPELQANANFQFPTLVGSNIYQADFFDDACPIFQKGLRFDWVMGNPPWERADERDESHRHALEWMHKASGLGLMQSDDAKYWKKELSTKLQKDVSLSCQSSLLEVDPMPHLLNITVSLHQRSNGAAIILYHIFLDCNSYVEQHITDCLDSAVP